MRGDAGSGRLLGEHNGEYHHCHHNGDERDLNHVGRCRCPRFSAENWDYIAFKGGSEPGLVIASWLVRDAEGTLVLAATVLDRPQPIEELEAVLVMAAARDLLGG